MLSLRLRTYRQLLHLDPIEDDSIQAYNQRWREAQDTAQSLFEELDSASHTHEEQTEILLTIFVLLQVGYRNDTLFTRAVEATYDLLPQLPETAESSETPILNLQCDNSCPSSVVRCQTQVRCSQFSILLTFLYQETQDEELLPYIDHFMSTWNEDAMTEEDRYLIELFQFAETV